MVIDAELSKVRDYLYDLYRLVEVTSKKTKPVAMSQRPRTRAMEAVIAGLLKRP